MREKVLVPALPHGPRPSGKSLTSEPQSPELTNEDDELQDLEAVKL